MLTELLELVKRQVVSGQVEPRVNEHRTMTSRKDETIAIEPLRILGVVRQLQYIHMIDEMQKKNKHKKGIFG
jgi:hypothetical protein